MAPLLLGGGLWTLLVSNSAGSYQEIAREVALEEDENITLLQELDVAQKTGSRYMEGGTATDRTDYQHAAANVDRALAQNPYDEEAEKRELIAVDTAWESGKNRMAAFRPGASGDPEDAFQADLDAAAVSVQRLILESAREVRDDLAIVERREQLNWLLGLAAVALALVLAALLANRLSKGLVRPLQQFARAARSLATGRLDHRVSIHSSAELNEVGATFNAMASALQDQRTELERQAFSDMLTGLPNRALFEDRARHALDRAAGAAERVAVLVLDVDGFKLVNDGLGHAAGDRLLVQATERMAALVRPSDTLARLGSDQFALLLENVRGLDDALGAADRLRQAFGTPFMMDDSDVLVTASVGIALSSETTSGASDLLRRADLAMHRVKQRGKNASEFFDPDMDDKAAERLVTLTALHKAVELDQLVVHYQPIVDLDSGEVRAAEALLRWERPGMGTVPPVEFIPLAEETGLIVQLGRWVLQAACTEAHGWTASAGSTVPVTVNVSARQLLDRDFEDSVAAALATSGLDPSGLILEVTESSVMQSPDATIAKLDRISATGVRIALDDFGEGYSSLGHLRDLPIDILKIARPFVGELTQPNHDPALVRGIIELARSLGLRLVAEGIERPEQRAILRAFDCALGQGFLFARPMPGADLQGLLTLPARAAVAD
jgi:diguanylate cyclase (GGDEF)-like protein